MAVSDAALSALLPNGTPRYLALLTTLPASDGSGIVEASGSGYARVSWDDWIDATTDGLSYRTNNGTAEFAQFTAELDGIVGTAIYDASSSGTLIAYAPLSDVAGNLTTVNLRALEVPRFIAQDLQIGGSASILDWTSHTAASNSAWASIAYSPSLALFCAVSNDGHVMTSPDMVTWTTRTAAEANNWQCVCWSPEKAIFVAVANSGTHRVMTSADGVTWIARSAAEANTWQSVCWAASLGSGLFVAVATSGTHRVMTSADGTTWSTETAASADGWYSICWAPTLALLVAVASSGSVMTSTDAVTWNSQTAPEANSWSSVVWADALELLVAVANSGTHRVMTSADGVTWIARSAAEANYWNAVCWSPDIELLVAFAQTGTHRVMTSVDGVTWVTATAAEADAWQAGCWSQTLMSFCAVASSGTHQVQSVGVLIGGTAILDSVDELSLSKLQALLPPGVAWTRDADAELTLLVRALAYEYARVNGRALDFLDEIDPRTTFEMLPDHERVWGLPGECTAPTTIDGRRKALQGKMLGYLPPSIPNLTAIAASLGYMVTITEIKHTAMFVSTSPCTAAVYTRQWMFLWVVTTPSGANDDVLQCVLEDIAPDHTVLSFTFT